MIVLAIVLVIVGPGRLSGMGNALGESVRSFRAATREPVAPRSKEAVEAVRTPPHGTDRADQADPTVYGRSVELTAKEFEVLELFLRHPRQVLSREQVYERV